MDLQEQNTTIKFDTPTTTDGNYSASEENDISPVELSLMIFTLSLILFAAILSIVTCVVAFVFWIKIPKWRTFKNYVFLNLIFSYTALYAFFAAQAFDISNVFTYYFVCSFSCWLFIGSVIFYMDIVKVFSVNVTRRKLKSTLFAWGAPLLNSSLNILDQTYYSISVFRSGQNVDCFIFILLVCNFLMYIRVLYSLFRVTRFRSRTRYMQKVQVTTFTFFMSGSLMLPTLVLSEYGMSLYGSIIAGIMPFIQTIALSTCFLMLKSNRKMWSELCGNNTENIRLSGLNST